MRAVANAAGFALGVALLLLTLPMLAARITARHLLVEAQQELATLQSGQPLWHWQLRKPHDLIAGRAFGQARLTRADDGLRVTSMDGTPFELGLPITQTVDLAHWPILQLRMRSDAAGTLGLIWQGDPGIPACLAPSAAVLVADTRELRLDLRKLDWRTAQGKPCPTPGNALMLRLRLQLPAGTTLQWRSAALLSGRMQPSSPPDSIDLPSDAGARQQSIATAASRAELSATPLFRLPSTISAETMLALRDQLSRRWPAALVVPAGAAARAAEYSRRTTWSGWAACAAYLLILLGLTRYNRRSPMRDGLDIAACMTGPLWLIVGLQWGPGLSQPGVAASIGALLYAAAIEWRQRPGPWQWNGRNWQAWAWPLAMLPVTLLLMLGYGHGFKAATPPHVLAYMAWAALQQWMMLAVVMRRLERLVKQPAWAILITATLFALLHTPNGRLMQLCLFAELWWAWCFLRSRSLLPIALAHAACALLVEAGLVGSLLRSLEVSARFFS